MPAREQWAALGVAIFAAITGVVIGVGMAIVVIWALTGNARAHSWYSPYCCNMQDCGPITKAEQRDGKWYYTNRTGKPVAADAETQFHASKDGQTHSCEWYGKLRCLYIPGGN
jgi:hypothetical protein